MQPDFKQTPNIEDTPIDSNKPAKQSKRIVKYKEWDIDLGGKIDPFSTIDVEAGKENKSKIVEQIQRVGDVVEKVVSGLEQEKLNQISINEPYSDEWYNDENVGNAINKLNTTLEAVQTSLPNKVHTQQEKLTKAFFLEEQKNKLTSAFLEKYGKLPSELLAENPSINPQDVFDETAGLNTLPEEQINVLKEAKSLVNLNNIIQDLHGEKDSNYWEQIDWNKPFYESITKDFVSGLAKDHRRAVLDGLGIPSYVVPGTPEGDQFVKNNIYKYDWSVLPEDSFLKQSIKDKDAEQIFNFALMDKLPGQRPFLIDAMKTLTSSFAALPFYMSGLSRLNLITRTGESGLFTMGSKEFTKNLLKSPFYTQPGMLAKDVLDSIDKADNVGDLFAGIGKAYLTKLPEVLGEISTPILAKYLRMGKLYPKVADILESRLDGLASKFNMNIKTGVDYLLLSPVTETFEEEITNFLNLDPSVFTGDFDARRLGLEAISSLGLGVPIGIIKSITSNKIDSDNSDEIGNKIVDFAVQTLKDNPELYNELREQMNAPDKSDFDILESIKKVFTGETQLLPTDPTTLNMGIKWGRNKVGEEKTYELSTQGDKRFSALNAKLKDGRTIEEAYQLDVKGYRQQGNDWKLGKGKPPLNNVSKEELYQQYKSLWKQWAIENPDLIQKLTDYVQKEGIEKFTDRFASTEISQARALAEIISEQSTPNQNESNEKGTTKEQAISEYGDRLIQGVSLRSLQEKIKQGDEETILLAYNQLKAQEKADSIIEQNKTIQTKLTKLKNEIGNAERTKVGDVLKIYNDKNASDYKGKVIAIEYQHDGAFVTVETAKKKQYSFKLYGDGSTKDGNTFVENFVLKPNGQDKSKLINEYKELKNQLQEEKDSSYYWVDYSTSPQSKPIVQNDVQPNTNTTVANNENAVQIDPDNDALDKVTEKENARTDLKINLTSNGIVKAIHNKTGISVTPRQLFEFVQSFNTGNTNTDFNTFKEAWVQKFGPIWLEDPTNIPSNRTFLEEMFAVMYHSSIAPSATIDINKNGINVAKYENDAYIDADETTKSLISNKELWEQVAKILPEGMEAIIVKNISNFGTNYTSFNDLDLGFDSADVEKGLLSIRDGLMKSGYVWLSGIIPGSKTALLIDVRQHLQSQNIDLSNASPEQLNEVYNQINNDLILNELLGENLSTLDKFKRVKGISGKAPQPFVTDTLKDKLSNTNEASSIYYKVVDGKEQINYKYVVLDASTIPTNIKDKIEVGDGAELVTTYLGDIYNDLFGIPYEKRGAMKPKHFDIQKFWKWARSYVLPKSQLEYAMTKNGIAGVVLSSAIKVGKTENLVTWEQLTTMQNLPPEFVYEHNLMTDSSLSSKGHISTKASGFGPNVLTTGVTLLMNEKEREVIRDWMKQDFQDAQKELQTLIKDPKLLSDVLVEYARKSGYQESDIVRFIDKTEGLDNLVRLPALMDFFMKGYFKSILLDAVRHSKFGSAPALIPDMGSIQSFVNISGANKEAFDDKGFIKRGYRVIDYYTAKEKKLQVGSHLIEAFNPPGSFADMRAVEVAAILPKEMGRNLYAGNIEEMQQNSGKDFDIDITGIALLRTDTDKKVWAILKKLDVDGKYETMMKKFSKEGQAKTILTKLASNFTQNNPDAEIPEDINPENPKNIRSWALIAPMVKLNFGGKGVFTLNTRYGVMDNKNPQDWATLNRMSKEGLIGILYNWKAIYTLFLENNYEINGVKANPDTDFNLPMLKVLTDMSLDWTKQYDIGKINFNWNDLIKQLFIIPKGMSLKTFNESIKPLRDAFKLIKLEDKELAKYDYVSYLKQLQNIRLSLATMPKGLENSSLAILTRGIASLELPKFNLTMEQARHSNEVVRAQMLGVKPSDVKKAQVANYNLLLTTSLGNVSRILKALSTLGIRSNNQADMLANVRDLLSFSYSTFKKHPTSLVASAWHNWLNAIMENPVFNPSTNKQQVVFGTKTNNGYRYRISHNNNKAQYEILGISDGKITSHDTLDSWNDFIAKGGANLHQELFQPGIIRLFDIVKISENPIVKQRSDELLTNLFADITKNKGFLNIPENTRKAFYLGFMGYLDQLKKDVTAYESILTHKIDIGANIKGGKSDIRVDKSTVTKQEVASYIKPIMLMLDYAMNNDKLAEEMLGTWFDEMNNAIGNEIAKEKQGSVLNGAMPLTIIPLPIQHAEAKGIDTAKLIRALQKQFGDKFNIVKYIDTLVNENILGNKKDVKRFNKLIERALVETDKKYGAKWKMALMNPLVNSHTIPFDVFVDLFGKKDKLYSGMDDVYEYALNGNKHRIKAWQIQMKFLHWGMQDKAKLISNPQIWWYVQDSIDRNFESKRINLQEVVTSVNTFMMHSSRDIPHIDLEQAIVEQVISDAFDMAESNGFQDKIKDFDLTQDVKKYYEFAKTIYSGTNMPSANELRAIVGAMRFRHIFDNLVPDLIKQQLQNLNHIKDLAAQKENLSAWHVADLFIAELNGMLKQIRNKANYMPHAWLNEEEWLKGAEQMFIDMGYPETAKKKAKEELEKMEAKSSHIGGTGQYIDIFFLKRRADMQGYMKTGVPAEKYINQLIRLLRFQQLYANEELAEDLIKDEIPFLIKHAKEMSAILRGANKYGVKMDFKDLRKNDNVIFAVKYFNKRGTVGKVTEDSIEIDGIVYPKSQFNHAFRLDKVTGKYTHDLVELDDVKQGDFLQFAFKQILKTGKVSKVNETEIELSDGSKYKRFEVEAVRKLHGNNLITRAKLALDKLGIDSNTSKPALGKMTNRILRLEAEAMLTGSAFAVRNVIGGTLQSIALYGYKAHSEAVDVLRGKELANPEAIENLTDEHKELYKLVYDNSIALLGNLSEVMGKLGGVIDVLGNTQNIDATRLQEMILLGTEWDGIKADLTAYGLTDSMKIRAGIRFTRFRSKLVRFANGNFLSFIPFIKRSTLVDPKEGEKQLRFSVALTAALVHTGGNTGLNINDPIQKQMLVAYIDNAVRQTQYLYRVGLDQGILESSPLARTFLVNYLHYPISSFITQIRYFDNMIKQIDQYGVKRILVGGFIDMNETSTDKKRYGTQTIPVTITMFKGSPQEFSFTYADVNYARVFARSFFIGFIGAIIRKAGRSLIPAFRFTAGDTAKGLMQLSALLASSYTNFGADVIWELTSYLLSLTFAPGDDDKYLKLLKRALHDSEQDYIKRSLDNKHDAKFIASYSGDIKKALEHEHTLRVIDRVIDMIPAGVGQRQLMDALLITLVNGVFLPENYLEWGVGYASTIMPGVRPLRGTNLIMDYPIGVGYSPLQTKKIKYFDKDGNTSNSNSKRTPRPTRR